MRGALAVTVNIITRKTKLYMKKVYISPLMTEVNVEAEQMLAASVKVGSDDQTVDTSTPGNQLGGGHRGTWGNLWE